MPVYLVTVEGTDVRKLIDAPNQASARNYVGRQIIATKVATGKELFEVAKSGGEMETVGEQAAEPEATNDDDDTTVADETTAADGVKRTVGEPRRAKAE